MSIVKSKTLGIMCLYGFIIGLIAGIYGFLEVNHIGILILFVFIGLVLATIQWGIFYLIVIRSDGDLFVALLLSMIIFIPPMIICNLVVENIPDDYDPHINAVEIYHKKKQRRKAKSNDDFQF